MSSVPTDRMDANRAHRAHRGNAGRAWGLRLAPTQALWLGTGGLWDHGAMPGWRPWAPAGVAAGLPHRHASFDAWCQARPGQGCQLILSAWLLHELLLDAQLPLADDSARLAYARRLLQHYHGEAAAQWPLAAWQAGGRHGVSALHAITLPALQASARQAGVVLRGVRPWWSLALAMAWQRVPALARAGSGRLLVVDGTLVTQVELAQGRVQQLLQRRLADARPASLLAWHAALPPVDCGVALGHGLDAPWRPAAGDGLHALGTLDGPAPDALWAASGQTATGHGSTAAADPAAAAAAESKRAA